MERPCSRLFQIWFILGWPAFAGTRASRPASFVQAFSNGTRKDRWPTLVPTRSLTRIRPSPFTSSEVQSRHGGVSKVRLQRLPERRRPIQPIIIRQHQPQWARGVAGSPARQFPAGFGQQSLAGRRTARRLTRRRRESALRASPTAASLALAVEVGLHVAEPFDDGRRWRLPVLSLKKSHLRRPVSPPSRAKSHPRPRSDIGSQPSKTFLPMSPAKRCDPGGHQRKRARKTTSIAGIRPAVGAPGARPFSRSGQAAWLPGPARSFSGQGILHCRRDHGAGYVEAELVHIPRHRQIRLCHPGK
jgi:hypothetical protein